MFISCCLRCRKYGPDCRRYDLLAYDFCMHLHLHFAWSVQWIITLSECVDLYSTLSPWAPNALAALVLAQTVCFVQQSVLLVGFIFYPPRCTQTDITCSERIACRANGSWFTDVVCTVPGTSLHQLVPCTRLHQVVPRPLVAVIWRWRSTRLPDSLQLVPCLPVKLRPVCDHRLQCKHLSASAFYVVVQKKTGTYMLYINICWIVMTGEAHSMCR